jgi:hypothetical protein
MYLLVAGPMGVSTTLQRIMDSRNNPNVIQEAVPTGLSQVSFLSNQEENDKDGCGWDGDWDHPLEELSDEKRIMTTSEKVSFGNGTSQSRKAVVPRKCGRRGLVGAQS